MRLWSLHPRYLDPTGLVALWREALLAQAVLHGDTRGYRHHPQLRRFQECADPRAGIAAYLWAVQTQAAARGYRFDAAKIRQPAARLTLTVTTGQMAYEWQQLVAKLAQRAPAWLAGLAVEAAPQPHPLFTVEPGDVAPWEITRGR
ncbi:pyrimidine dimer DNA glycosylase/endonuclease V [Immundisolibacter sp.]|uniref:pyrimidine dimer DNA glycosylase/endonuclease V n=1 Tax=Immundisolibacter sp. TaxID=1934948 RepID=UPI00262724CB|nr:pyrimidine dimer DNA glycosylase/endonuclease V [Immundisolibacter sp.]MDD3649875.1 pyrimidine dimer DNA glycosylase/endonuclease V [Immundisolibacter sp.]